MKGRTGEGVGKAVNVMIQRKRAPRMSSKRQSSMKHELIYYVNKGFKVSNAASSPTLAGITPDKGG